MANDAQIEQWNGEQARRWVASQHRHEVMLEPFARRLLQAARITPRTRLLDIGCGCGETTLAAARTAPAGIAVGIDVSAPMLSAARHRAAGAGQANARFVQADAQICPFPPRSFGLAISRFGVMFFDDPVAAFTNIGAALAPGGHLVFVCWQAPASNEFVLVPALALAEHLPLPAPAVPGAPGMFALADPGRTRSVLTSAGFTDVTIGPLAERILLGGGGTLDDAVEFVRYGGMGRAVLAGADTATVDTAVSAVRTALAPFAGIGGVRIGAAAWLVSARRP